MFTRRGLALALLMALTAAAAAAAAEAEEAWTWFVATGGDDACSGRRPDVNSAQSTGPFATLGRALQAVRAARSAAEPTQPARIVLRGGTYRLVEPIALGPDDARLTIEAHRGEKPVLTGGRVVSDWRPWRGPILTARLPDWQTGDRPPRQLFFRGRRQVLARTPDLDPDDPLYGGWAFIEQVHGATRLGHAPDQFPRTWAEPGRGEIVIFPWLCWLNDAIPIAAVDPAGRTITLARGAGEPDPRLAAGTHYTAIPHPLTVGNRFYLQNLLEELDQPGEWCHRDGTLYFRPPQADPVAGDVTIPTTGRLIALMGTRDRPIREVTIRGLTFTQTSSLFPPRYLECNAPNSRGFALYLQYAAHCRIEGNTFDHVGGDAIRLEYDSTANHIVGNVITDAGAMGINFNNTDFGGFEFPQLWRLEVLEMLVPGRPWARANVITDNRITRCGVIDKFGAAIKVHGLNCVDNVIAHNLIHHVPHVGIAITHGFGRNIIAYNHIHDVCLEMADTGAIYSNRWFPFPPVPELAGGTIVRHNLIHDVVGCAAYAGANQPGGQVAGGRIRMPYYTFGIYFDNSPTHVLVHGNVVAGPTLASVAMPVAVSTGNRVLNNILLPSGGCQALWISAGSDNRFLRNIVVHLHPTVEPVHRWPVGAMVESDLNLYFHDGPGPYVDGERKLAAWRGDGTDARTVVADPLFEDFAAGDYRLKPEAPALKLGFEPIPFERIGPRH